jgi:sulfite reductase alpha subunit-like flavoprotein
MAGDVAMTLQQIAIAQGGMDAAGARRWLAGLAHEGRYHRDVY